MQDVIDLCTVLAEVLPHPFWVAGAWADRALGRAVQAVGAPMILLIEDSVDEVAAQLHDVGFGPDHSRAAEGTGAVTLSDREERRVVLVQVTTADGTELQAVPDQATESIGGPIWAAFTGQLDGCPVQCALPPSERRQVERRESQAKRTARRWRRSSP